MSKDYSDYGIEIPFGRKSGHIKTFCPWCRDKRSNKRDRSLSVDLDRGLWKCHYCQISGGLPKERDMSSLKYQNRDYTKPALKGSALLSEKVIKWFSGRGITMPTLTAMKITEGKEWMPQKGKEVNTIQFNYYKDGELINTKFRTGDKCFKLVSNAELIPYNLDAIKGLNTAIITEGECFRGDAEILTSKGFVRFDEYRGEDVAVVDEGLSITFKQPIARIEKPYDGELVEFSNKFYYSLTTPGHNMFFINTRDGKPFKKTAQELESAKSVNWDIPTAVGCTTSEGLDISDDMLRFLVAVSADFAIRPWGALYCALKKERKIERLKMLISALRIKCLITRDCRGYASFYIQAKNAPKGVFKLFPNEWIGKLSARQCKLILEEIIHWDGNLVNGRNQIEYTSKEYHNATFIQTIAHMSGYNSTIMKRKNEYGSWYKVSILFGKDHVNTQSFTKQRVQHKGNVYCVQVDTGLIMVRQKGIVSITGNCDALSFVECGRTDVVSVPNGANANLSYLDDYLEEYFDDKEVIYIASDTDTKGVMLRQELIRRFGPERCKVVEYGEDCKDANEHLVKYGKESLLQCLDNATEPKIEGVFAVEDVEKPLDLLYQKGLQRGYTIGFENFDELCSFERKRLCILTGIPSAGKSAWLNFIAVRLNMLYDWKFAFFSPESMPIDYHISTLIELITGKKFSKETLPLLEYEAAKEYANDNFFFIYPDSYTMGNILEKAKSLVRRKGIKALVIDPYNRVESEQDYRQSETQHISKVLDQLTNFAQQNDVLVFLMAHPTKMPKNPDGKFQVPTLYDISGSANFYNKADFGISVHRDKEFGWTEIHVQKVKYRHLGQGGMAKFKYNLFNSRYVPYEDNVPPNWDNSNYLAAKVNSATMSSIFEPNTEFDDLPF